MVAFAAFTIQAQATGKGPLQNLSDHLSAPFCELVACPACKLLGVPCAYSSWPFCAIWKLLAGRVHAPGGAWLHSLLSCFHHMHAAASLTGTASLAPPPPCSQQLDRQHWPLHGAHLCGRPGPDHPPELPVARPADGVRRRQQQGRARRAPSTAAAPAPPPRVTGFPPTSPSLALPAPAAC